MEHPGVERLRRQQAWRGPRERDTAVQPLMKAFLREQTRAARTLAAVAESFESIVPPPIARRCAIVGVKAGVLTVEVDSSAAQFALDRELRQGAEAALRARLDAAAIRITKVRLVRSNPGAPQLRS